MKLKYLVLILIMFSSLFGFAQSDKFKDVNDSGLVVSSFQMDVIEGGGLKEEFSTSISGFHDNPVIVYQTFKGHLGDGVGDPMCLWLNESTIDTIQDIKWVKVTELYEKGKWVFLSLLILEKKKNITQTIALYKYKIKKTKIGHGPKNYFRKIKVKKYLP